METIKKGKYGANIVTRTDGEGFDVYYLYNMGEADHENSAGDVWERKTFKARKTVERKIEAYFKMQDA